MMNAAVIDFEDLKHDLALHTRRRTVSEQDLRRFEGYMAEIFTAMGMDLTAQGTERTPQRFVRALLDMTAGYDGDPKLLTVFDAEYGDGTDGHLSQVVEGPIPFYALCEHHSLPFYGQAHIGYIAHEHIIGISKLTRLVRLFARRFTLQERLGQQIADSLETVLHPHGVAVYLEAHHLCKQMRGVQETSPLTRTSVWRGDYQSNPALRSEFLMACGLKR
jgi:GTP cyclohydrolase I